MFVLINLINLFDMSFDVEITQSLLKLSIFIMKMVVTLVVTLIVIITNFIDNVRLL